MQLKKVLSSIPEAPLSVECLMNDIDFRSSMSREKMEELAAPILERVRPPLAKVRRPSLHVATRCSPHLSMRVDRTGRCAQQFWFLHALLVHDLCILAASMC